MIKEPEVKLLKLKKGDCFMYNRFPYIVKDIYWEDLGMLKRKVYICQMKFDDYDTPLLPDTDVFRISRGLFDLLVQTDEKE